MAIITLTGRPRSVRNRCVIEVFDGVFVLSRFFLDFSVGVGASGIGLSQMSSFFSAVSNLVILYTIYINLPVKKSLMF